MGSKLVDSSTREPIWGDAAMLRWLPRIPQWISRMRQGNGIDNAGTVNFGLGWAVKTPVSPEGHEAITRAAVGSGVIPFTLAGRPLTKVMSRLEQDQLIAGVRSVDLGFGGSALLFSLTPSEQSHHSLRRTYEQPQPAAVADIIADLRTQHRGILAERDPSHQTALIGRALHLIQDSFSPAHTERLPNGSWCIRYVRNFGRGSHPAEHETPSDARDQIPRSGAPASQATSASRRYLQIVFKAIYGVRTPNPAAVREAATEFDEFIKNIFQTCLTPNRTG
jgi:hypothetical protein